MTPVLRMAVLSGVEASVQLHLRLGGAVDVMDNKGRTPLILAASRGHVAICRLLLDAGADPVRVDMDGNDALRAATAKGHHAVVGLIQAAASSASKLPPTQPQLVEVEHPRIEVSAADQLAIEVMPETTADAPAVNEPAPSEIDTIREVGPLTPSVPADAPHKSPSKVDRRLAVPSPRIDEEEFNLSGWEEETDSPPPTADPTCVGLAGELQRRLSLHVPIDLEAGWDDVDIDLPEILVSSHRRAKLDGDGEAALEKLVLAAVADGRTRGDFLALVAPRDKDYPNLPDPDYIANLRVMFGDMGVVVDDDPAAPDQPTDPDETEGDRLREAATEGLAFLRILNSNRADPLTHYIGGLPRDRLTVEDEALLAMEIERSTKAALAAIAMSPAAVLEILAAVEAVIGGETPPGNVLGFDDEERDDGNASLDEEVGLGTHRDDMLTGPSISPEQLSRLTTIRDLCRSFSQGQDGGFAERLGDRLAALGLSHAFMSRLRRAVESDPLGVEARRRMQIGLETVRRARERFALANLKLVVWSTKRFGGLTWPDRIQEGNLGLLRAVELFDRRRGAKFSTYANLWIKQAVTRAVADKGRTIRLPMHVQEAMRKMRQAQNKVFALTGREALPEEVAELTEIPLAKVRRLLAAVEEPASLDVEEVGRHAAEIASPNLDPEERLAVAQIKAIIRRQLELLPPRDAMVIRLRFGIRCEREYTLEEVGQQLGVTRERIRQIEAKALRRLSRQRRIKALEGCR